MLIVAFTALLITLAGFLLGRTRPHPAEAARPARDGVLAAVAVVGFTVLAIVYSRLGPCVENPCLPWELIPNDLVLLGLFLCAVILGLSAYGVGRQIR